MLISKNRVSTFIVTRNNRDIEVIPCGKCGDHFGYVVDIKTGEKFSTYGYPGIPTGRTIVVTMHIDHE